MVSVETGVTALLHDIGAWLWRIGPGNPILIRVVSASGRRPQHAAIRGLYLATLLVGVVWLGSLQSSAGASLADLAKQSTRVFVGISLVQLLMLTFLAPVFTAGAITQEKDANTYDILLTTPLSNAQIVLGSLLGRLLLVWALLISGLPIFCITMLYGGVTAAEVFESFGLAACTALVTAALAIAISVLRIRARRTLLWYFTGIAVYVIGLGYIGLRYLPLPEAAPGADFLGSRARFSMSSVSCLHPFLALFVVTGQTPAPAPSDVAPYGWPRTWLLARPQYGYMLLTVLASTLLILFSLTRVRRAAEGQDLLPRWRDRLAAWRGQRSPRRRARPVWNNPIAWREAQTRAAAGGRSALRWVLAGAGLLAGLCLLLAHENAWWGLQPPQVRDWLTVLLLAQLAVLLLVAGSTAASGLTRERELRSLELLLVTPLTSADIVGGLLRGVVYFVWPLLTAPALNLLLFVLADGIHGGGRPAVTSPEAVVLTPLLMASLAAAAAMLGLHCSLQWRTTAAAVMVSTGVMLLFVLATWGCGAALWTAGPRVAAVVMPFVPVSGVGALVNLHWLRGPQATPVELLDLRLLRGAGTVASAAAYAGLTLWMQRVLVRNFDMTVRRQMV